VTQHRQAAFSLLEVVIVMILIAIGSAAAAPMVGRWNEKQNFKSAGREAASLIGYARSQAVRTGDVHVVFFDTDAQGNGLTDSNGDPVPMLVLNDGVPGSANQNCKIDGGEPTRTLNGITGVSWGLTSTAGKVGTDNGDGNHADGWSFEDPDGNDSNWLLFRPQGVPFSFAPDCDLGDSGSGGGAIYFTDGKGDQAVVITPLGSVRVHVWRNSVTAWSS